MQKNYAIQRFKRYFYNVLDNGDRILVKKHEKIKQNKKIRMEIKNWPTFIL
jgi:molecular chaperone GrpE (heat shock protein)